MNIAYINGYQGKSLLRKRPLNRGRALAGSFKSMLIAKALAQAGNIVFSIPFGLPTERSWKRYPRFVSRYDEDTKLSVIYPGAFDAPYIGLIYTSISILLILLRLNKKFSIDAVIIFNLGIFQILYAAFLIYIVKIPVVIEYEDDASVGRDGNDNIYNTLCKKAFSLIQKKVSGCFAVSERLLNQFPENCKKYLLPGVIAADIVVSNTKLQKERKILFAGGLNRDKGVDVLLSAWEKIKKDSGWELNITGVGPLHEKILNSSLRDPTIKYHGYLERNDLVTLFKSVHACVNPHRLTNSPGNIFPFKLYEYIAAGTWVVTTPIAEFENEIKSCCIITKDDSVESLYTALVQVFEKGIVPERPQEFVLSKFGIRPVGLELNKLI